MTRRTWIDPESHAYPDGTLRASRRRGRAIWPDGEVRAFTAGIPDTLWTVPAYGRVRGRYVAGFIYVADWRDADAGRAAEGELLFRPLDRYADVIAPADDEHARAGRAIADALEGGGEGVRP